MVQEKVASYRRQDGQAISANLLDIYLRVLKTLCKSEIYKGNDGQLLDLWAFYQAEVCPIIANDLPFDLRYTGKYLFIAMYLEADLGITLPQLPKDTLQRLSKVEEHDARGEEFNLVNGVKDRLKLYKVPFEMGKKLGKCSS